MKTKLSIVDPKAPLEAPLTEAVALLKNDEVVAFPTETVYGLGANGLSEKAVAKIFKAKGRPADNPLILHVADLAMVAQVAEISQAGAVVEQLGKKFWPGPLTLVLPKKPIVPNLVTAGLSTVAVRVPAHPVAQKLIEECGFALAAPSANRSGRPSPTTADMVLADLDTKIGLILDGGRCDIGLESTVVDLSIDSPAILRPGRLIAAELAPYLPGLAEYTATKVQQETPRAPGMHYQHYTPDAKVVLYADIEAVKDFLKSESARKPVVITLAKGLEMGNAEVIYFEGLEALTQNLYYTFYEAEQNEVDLILVPQVEERGLGTSLMNRLKKAASFSI